MTISSYDIKEEQEALLYDSRTQDGGLERRLVDATITTFTTPIEAGDLYYVLNESTTTIAFFRIDGTDPNIDADGTASDIGIPIGPLEKMRVYFTDGADKSLKIAVSGSARITLYKGGIR